MTRVKELFDKFNFEYLEDEGCYVIKVYDCDIKNKNDIAIASHAFGIYCKEPMSYSKFHRLKHDEFWHFYEGGKFKLYILYPDGKCETTIMGSDVSNGEEIYKLVPAGAWQAAELIDGDYALFGCTLAPAFEKEIFELRDQKKLIEQYPDYKNIIERL